MSTFRDPTASSFRYTMPTVGLFAQRIRWAERRANALTLTADWGQHQMTGRFFQRVIDWSIGYQKQYQLSPTFQIGWQTRFRMHIHYDRLGFASNRGQSLGGNILLEAAPVGTYTRLVNLFGNPIRVEEQLSIPLVTGALGGSYGASEPYVGLAFPNVTNTIAVQTLRQHKRNWKFAYQWTYTQLGITPVYQQQAYNGLAWAILL